MSSIEPYLDSLCKLIRQMGVSSSFVNEARANVAMQINSFLSHWHDLEFRNTLLIIGKEEGEFYKPLTPINPFVVVTIRNSLLETLNSVNCVQAGLTKHVGPTEVKRITQQAIRYFAAIVFDELGSSVHPQGDGDIYGNLAEKYPLAWAALWQLGNREDNSISYQPPAQRGHPITLGMMPSQEGRGVIGNNSSVAFDGFSKTIDPVLRTYLDDIRTGKRDCIYFDSFKMATRNIEKLLFIIEYILTHKGAFCTANYYIANGYTERRAICLQPTSSDADVYSSARKRQLLAGDIGKAHQHAIKCVYGT